MSDPVDYRISAWSLRDALADDDRLAELEARPTGKENRAALDAARFTHDPHAKRATGQALVDAGFRYLGTKSESASYRRASVNDVFVDPDETTYVVLRRRRTLLPLSAYYILTYFADGTCLETVARTTPIIPSEGVHVVRPGHANDVLRDVEEHLAAVRERAEAGARILPVRDLDTVDRLAKYFYAQIASPRVASSIANARNNERKLAVFALSTIGLAVYVLCTAHGC